MYEIRISEYTPLGNIQRCIKELQSKVLSYMLDVDLGLLVIDSSISNKEDVKGTLYATLGVEYINEFRDTSLNNNNV